MRKFKMILLGTAVMLVSVFGGCDSAEKPQQESVLVDSKDVQGDKEPTATQAPQKKKEDREFVSADRSISITLPEGWKTTHDQRSLCSFSSDEGDTIEITYTEGKARMASIHFPMEEKETKEVFKESGESGSVKDFDSETSKGTDGGEIEFYRYDAEVQNESGNTEYRLYTGVRKDDQAYQVVASLTSSDLSLMQKAEEALGTLQFLEQEEMTKVLSSSFQQKNEWNDSDTDDKNTSNQNKEQTGSSNNTEQDDAPLVSQEIKDPDKNNTDKKEQDSDKKKDEEKDKKEKEDDKHNETNKKDQDDKKETDQDKEADRDKETDEEPVSVIPEGGTAVCSSDVNIRTAPNTSGSQVLGAVRAGETVKVTGVEGNWYQIEYEGQTAYVCIDYFQQ